MDFLFFAFSNSQSDRLDTLEEEYDAIREALLPLVKKQEFHADWEAHFNRSKLPKVITDNLNDLMWFHYSGHAGRDSLEANDEKINSEGLIDLFFQCPNLKVVFLNGCSTQGQVKKLLKKVPIVIGTSSPIKDQLATKFSKTFYRALSKGKSIIQAFELAKGGIKTVKSLNFYRGTGFEDIQQEELWGIFYEQANEHLLNESLSTISRTSKHLWKDVDVARIHFKDWFDWYKYSEDAFKFPFYPTGEISLFIESIHSYLKEQNGSVRLIGLPGLGKSRLAFEAFRLDEEDNLSSVLHHGLLYFDYEGPKGQFNNIIEYIDELKEHNREGYLVIDNCPIKLHRRLKREINGSKLRILTIDSSHQEIEDFNRGYLNHDEAIIKLMPKHFKPIIKKIIESAAPSYSEDEVRRLEKMAEGYPLMAILLAKEVPKGQQIGLLTDTDLVLRLLGLESSNNDEYLYLQACAIFERFGFFDERKNEFDLLRSSRDIIGPRMKDFASSKETIYEICVQYLDRGIFDRSGSYISLKPKPLAIRLAADWWRNCSSERAERILGHLSGSKLIESLCDQLRLLDTLDEARKITEDLCKGPFRKAEVLNSREGSRLFRSLVEVNPEATLEALNRAFGGWGIEELKTKVGPGRRNLVWALEKLSFRENLFEEAVKLMYKFAVAENEHISNNATGQFIQFFQVYLPGTEVNLDRRFDIIKYGLEQAENRYKELAIVAMSAGLNTDHFSRMGGAEQQGSGKALTDYVPSQKEIFSYWEKIIDKLSELACSEGDFQERAKAIIVDKIRGLCHRGAAKLILSTVRKIHECGDGVFWEEGLKNLNITLRYEKRYLNPENLSLIEELIDTFSPNTIQNRYKQIVMESSWYEVEDMDFQSQEKYTKEKIGEFVEDFFPHWGENVELFFQPTQHSGQYFGRKLAEKIKSESGDEGIKFFQDKVLEYIYQQEDLSNIDPNVVYGFHLELNDVEVSSKFFLMILENPRTRPMGFQIASYIPLSIQSLWRLFDLIDKNILPVDGFTALKFSRRLEEFSIEDVMKICDKIATYNIAGKWVALIVLHSYCWREEDRFRACSDLFRKILMSKNLWVKKEKQYSNNDAMDWQMASTRLLEKAEKDFELAEHLTKEIAALIDEETANVFSIDQYFKSVLTILIRDYFDIAWPHIANGLLGSYTFRWHDLIGSRLDAHYYSEGILFEYGDLERIFEWCQQNKPMAPLHIAYLMPQFLNEEERTKLHPFTKRIIDEFGNLDRLMVKFEANLGSYGIWGSAVELLESRKKLVEPLKDNHHPEVRAWAKSYTSRLEEEIKAERNRDAEWGI